MKWFTGEAGSAAAAHILEAGPALHAPDLLGPEVGNALWRKVMRKEISADEAETLATTLAASEIHFHATRRLMPSALRLACALEHPAYDCFYLALARHLGAPVVTADSRLLAKVAASGRRLAGDLVRPLSDWG